MLTNIFLGCLLQTQRLAVEYQEIPQESAARIPIWRGSARNHALVHEFVVTYRPKAAERRHGVSASE